ncbi:MAG: endo-1,4-beta-xylanase [Prevotella sp.]|jgi:endo-1,4-beta-xylanase|nr:endo-1,4-beta-xylanase [Prevotella sp.]
MKPLTLCLCICLAFTLLDCSQTKKEVEVKEPSLKEALKDKFLIGTALNLNQIWGKDTLAVNIVKRQFSAIVAENCMKSMYLQPKEGEFYFNDADRFVDFGEQNGLFITGHTLIWHSQAPGWFFTDDKGKDVSKKVLIERIKNHITTVISRYKGRIKGWDVVNEAILDDGSWRDSKFYQIIGEDFIPLAFRFAHEADPDAELYYNDYNEWHAGKRDAIVKLIKSLKDSGLRIDAVGMQGHIGMDYPNLEEYKAAIDAYVSAGVKVMITELDLSALPSPRQKNIGANVSDTAAYRQEMNPYTGGLPDSVATAWTQRMGDFFNLFIANSEHIKRVTLWGVMDADSWKNDYPMPGRTDYALLFDREYKAKQIVKEIIEKANANSDTTTNSK